MIEGMQKAFTIGEASKHLHIDPKTLKRRCKMLGISPALISSSGRVKLFSQAQIEHLDKSFHHLTVQKKTRKTSALQVRQRDVQLRKLESLMLRLFAIETELQTLCQDVKSVFSLRGAVNSGS